MTKAKSTDLFDDSNVVKSNFISWKEIGQSVVGTYLEKKFAPNQLKPGSSQTLYIFEGDDGVQFIVAGRGNQNPSVLPGLEALTFGSYCGIKYVSDIESAKPGMNATKVIRVFSTGEKKLDILEKYQKRNSPFAEESNDELPNM